MIRFSRRCRFWIIGWTLLALISIQVIESTHHHKSSEQQNDCAICQFVLHQQLDVHPPLAAPLQAMLFFLFIVLYFRYVSLVTDASYTSYHSRAPPHSS